MGTGLQGGFLFKKIFLRSEGCRFTCQELFTPSNFLHVRLKRKRANSLDETLFHGMPRRFLALEVCLSLQVKAFSAKSN